MIAAQDNAIYSTLALEPDMAELVDLFVADLPRRLAILRRSVASADLNQLASAAHQLRGTAGSYGFASVTSLAAALEQAARKGDLAESQTRFYKLAEHCRRCRTRPPGGCAI